MIVGGIVVGAVASTWGYLFALWANRRWDIPPRPAVGVSREELEQIAARDESTLPPLWLSLLPIVIPVLLIAIGAIVRSMHANPAAVSTRVAQTLGEKNVALAIAAAVGLVIVRARKGSLAAVGEALGGAGAMVLIISAGGAFGAMLRQTDVAATIKDHLPATKLALLPLAFALATAVRTAQGSAIVSMVTAAGIVAPIAAAATAAGGRGLGFHPVYLALAIGCGSKPVMWMNDAGFWIIGRMSGFSEGETLKTATVMMALMGVVGLITTMLLAWVVPMV
jgi:GntP family gluconate:H+ symporter